MKTNVNMVRKMGNFDVTQRTKDGLFNATDLLKQWNDSNPKNKKEKVQLFLNNDSTKDFIIVLSDDLNGQKITHLSTRGKNGGTWMHPYLFIKFAMWLNPKFELQVIKFVHDQLIEFRHDAGDNYNGLTSAVQRFRNINYPQLAKGLNYIVFNDHEKGIRQQASQSELKEITDLQKKLKFAVDMGYIKSFDELLDEMRRMWHMKWDN